MLRAAIYGLGRWGMRLVDSVQDKSGKIRFVRGISRDPAKLREFSEKTRVALVSNYAEVLGDPQKCTLCHGSQPCMNCHAERGVKF